jgi:hypothetical protein
MSMVLGNPSLDFNTTVTQVGLYTLKAAWWNATSSAFEPAAETYLYTTNLLIVTTEFAAGSDPYTDLHTCFLAEEFQRGDGIIARGFVYYASTGELVNGTLVPTAKGNVTGTLLGATKALNYHNTFHFWRAAWQLPWDTPIGVFQFAVAASDGLGNYGSGISPAPGLLGALKIVPSILGTSVWTQNATSGARTTAFYRGEDVQVVVSPNYQQHQNHNWDYTNTDAVYKNQTYRVGPDRAGAARAVVGYGAFDVVNKTFGTQFADLTLAFDDASGTWRGTWAVPATGAFATNITVKAFVTDGAPTPNAGSATSYFSTLPWPEPVTNTVYQNNTIYQNRTVNQTVEVIPAGMIQGDIAYSLAGIGVAAGAGVGFFLAMRRLRGGGAASAPAQGAGAETKKGEEKKKEEDEGWS